MIKNLRKSSITYTPFKAFKEWKFDSVNSSSYIPFVTREGLKINGTFFPSESIYYSPLTEPTNSDGTYKRIIYDTIDHEFYRNDDDPLKCFGVENFVHENSNINGRISVVQLDRKYWGEKIVPNSVTITDYSNPDEVFVIKDDGNTNLYAQNKTFASYDIINPKEFPFKVNYTNSDPYVYYTLVNGVKSYMDRPAAIEAWKNGNGPVFTDDSKIQKDYVYLTHSYNPQNERFGSSISTYNTTTIIGSPSDDNTFSNHKSGRAFIYKVNPSNGKNDVIKKLYFDGSQASIINENSNSEIISTELGDFILYENGNLCTSKDTFVVKDNFGYSTAMTDKFAAIGAPTVQLCQPESSPTVELTTGPYASGEWSICVKNREVVSGQHRYPVSWKLTGTSDGVDGARSINKSNSSAGGSFTNVSGSINGSMTFSTGEFGPKIQLGSGYFVFPSNVTYPLTLNFTLTSYAGTVQTKSVIINSDGTIQGSSNTNNQSGLVFCYQEDKGGQNNWGLINVIQGENPSDEFGHSISIKGDTMAIGSPGFNSGSGAVYIFKLKRYMSNGCDSIPTSSLSSGYIITSGSGNFIVTSGSGDNLLAQFYKGLWQPVSDRCSVSAYSENELVPSYVVGDYTWRLHQKITGSASNLRFGGDVSISGDVLVVGNNSMTASTKLVWVYDRSFSGSICPSETWNLKTTLSSSGVITSELPNNLDGNNIPNNFFGYSVSTNGKYIAVGSPKDTLIEGFSVGSVYLYEYEIPVECSEVSGSDKEVRFVNRIYANTVQLESNDFGTSVSMNHNRLIVGAPVDFQSEVEVSLTGSNKFLVEGVNDYFGRNDTRSIDGNFYIYDLTNNNILEKKVNWTKRFGFPHRRFGYDVSIGNSLIGVGAPLYSFTEESSSLFTDEMYMDTSSNWLNNASAEMRGSAISYNLSDLSDSSPVGNVFYKNGIIVLTHTGSQFSNVLFTTGSEAGYTLEYKGQQTIHEQEIIVQINPGEFNISTNPTALIREIPFDVNGDGLFDANDLAVLLKYINGEPVVDLSKLGDSIGTEQNYKWWNNGSILTESEDLLLASSLFDNVSTLGVLTPERYQYIIDRLVNTGLLNVDLNYDILNPLPIGKIDENDAKILFYYFNKQLTPELLSDLCDDTSSRKYVKDMIDFLDRMTGNSSGGLLTRAQANVLKERSGSAVPPMYGVNNGSLIDTNFMNYTESSSINRTGSYLSPYITTVGLYNNGTLVGVGKLGKPVKNIQDYPINISVRFDFG